MEKHVRLMIVDDHQLFREGLKFLLKEVPWIILSGEAEDGKQFMELLKDIRPDIVLMDVCMPEMDGIEASRLAIKKYPGLKIIALTMFGEEHYYYEMIKAGARGFVMKKSGSHELINAIEKVLKGEFYFSDDLLVSLINKLDKEQLTISQNTESIKFTTREKQILNLLIYGFSSRQIAAELKISQRTVEVHKSKLFNKTGIRSTPNLILAAIRNNWYQL